HHPPPGAPARPPAPPPPPHPPPPPPPPPPVLLVSYEISELQALADRVVVVRDGVVTAELPAAEATEENLGAAMSA
uniref:hypothetical protein n=1 Tax=Kineococcus sp. SYSU DK002 TaxID=3383123 RepID=UPI003D7C7292